MTMLQTLQFPKECWSNAYQSKLSINIIAIIVQCNSLGLKRASVQSSFTFGHNASAVTQCTLFVPCVLCRTLLLPPQLLLSTTILSAYIHTININHAVAHLQATGQILPYYQSR